jgi:hypothetical protein
MQQSPKKSTHEMGALLHKIASKDISICEAEANVAKNERLVRRANNYCDAYVARARLFIEDKLSQKTLSEREAVISDLRCLKDVEGGIHYRGGGREL